MIRNFSATHNPLQCQPASPPKSLDHRRISWPDWSIRSRTSLPWRTNNPNVQHTVQPLEIYAVSSPCTQHRKAAEMCSLASHRSMPNRQLRHELCQCMSCIGITAEISTDLHEMSVIGRRTQYYPALCSTSSALDIPQNRTEQSTVGFRQASGLRWAWLKKKWIQSMRW